MKFHKFKPYVKYGLFLILVISLAGTANAGTNHTGGIALSWDDTHNIESCVQEISMFQEYHANCTMNINSLSLWGEGTKENLDTLHAAGWEIAAHGYNHEDPIAYLNNYTSKQWLDQEIFPNIVEINSCGYPAYSFIYPYGSRNDTTDALLAPYFRTLRATNFGTVNVNESAAYYKWDNATLVYAVEIDDQSGVSLESIQSGIDYAIDNDYVLVLYGHKITSGTPSEYQTSTSRLDSILNYTYQNGGAFYRMEELGDSSWTQWSPRFSDVTANFTVFPDSVLAGETVTFVDYSVNQTAEQLNFGDGSANSSTANVVHTYTTPGTYTATLTVSNDVSSQSITKTITVIQPTIPVANFTSNPTTGIPPLNVAFTDASTGFPASWSWDFGDGSTSDTRNPTHNYSAVKDYTVSLTVNNANGTTSKTAVITVLQNPVADFSTNVTSGYTPLSVTFTDLSQNATSRKWDVNNDGVVDSNESSFVYTYTSAGTYTAKLTAINANGTNEKTAVITVLQDPVVDFSTNVTSGYYPLSVLFTDLSQKVISRSWDVNNDGVADSNEASFVYTYTSAGTYTAKLTVINEKCTNEKTVQIIVDRKSSGGSSGGGAGGSPEPAKNVEVKELSQVFITNGKPIKFEFTKNATCVVCVGFDAKKTAGKTTTIAEQLKGKSSLVSELPEGKVYKSFNVWVGNSGYATSNSIENRVLCFKVEKAWIQDKKIDKDSIALNRYSNKKWEQLPVSLSGEDNKYLYFKSSVPGYSSFAITGKTTANEAENEIDKTGDVISPKPETQEDDKNNTESEVNQTSVRRTRAPGFEMIYCILGLLGVFLYKRR